MSKKIKLLIAFLCVALFITAATIYTYFSSKIPSNPQGTVGNTAGNLNNFGYYCEDDKNVYFANAYDGYSLYSMTKDEQNLKKLGSAQIQYLNAGGNYLYFYQVNASASLGYGNLLRVNGLYRVKKNGRKALCLSKNTIQTVTLVDDYLFYQMAVKGETDLHLYRIGTDKSDEKEITDYLVNPACAYNSTLYFNGTKKDHYLYSMTTVGAVATLLDKNMWYPCVVGDYVYYMDMEHNYRLCRYSFSSGTEEILTEDRVDTFNVCDSYIYYQKNSTESPALMRMGIDGSNPEIVASGNYKNINITSQYVYFQDFGADTPVYHTPTYGAVNVTTFDAARDAALEHMDDNK